MTAGSPAAARRGTGLRDGRLQPCPATPNCVCSEDGGLLPLRSPGPAGEAWRRARAAVAGRPRTRIVAEAAGYLHAECRSALFRFVDDLELRLDDAAGVIHVRSASRLGRWDLGVNRRRVEALRAALAAQPGGSASRSRAADVSGRSSHR